MGKWEVIPSNLELSEMEMQIVNVISSPKVYKK